MRVRETTDMQDKQVRENQQTDREMPGRPQNSRPTIGLLIGETEDSISWTMWMGVDAVAQERGANLICFVGGALRAPYDFTAQANVLYDLVNPEILNGLVIWGGGLAQFTDPGEVRILCEQYRPLPVVNAALPLEGIPSILVDNYLGMHAAMVHLTEVHGYRRIAFIRGPEGHPEAEERYRAYTDVLARHALPLDADLIAPGEFSASSGIEAIALLLDERKLLPQADFEAVVAVDDATAIGAMEALRARGIRVPGDVAVVGFDDTEEAKAVTPPLTTVRQPIYEQGQQATEMLLALLEGKQVPERVMLPTELVVRQSCGCLATSVVQAAVGSVTGTGETFAVAFAAQREEILSKMIQAMGFSATGIVPEQAEQLLDAFSAELMTDSLVESASRGPGPGTFLSTLDDILGQVMTKGSDVVVWQEALSAMRCHTMPCLVDQEVLSRAEDLWQQARVMIGEAVQRAQVYRVLQADQQATRLREIGQALITTSNVTELMNVAAQELPRLGIKRGYVSLYEKPETPTEWSRLILAYDEEGRVELEAGGQRFPSRQLVPEGLLPQERRYSMVVEPLYFREDQLGIALFEASPREAMVYNVLREHLASALKRVLLVEQLESRALQLQTAGEVARAASRILNPDELIPQVVDLVRERFGLYYAGLFLVDQAGEWTGEPGRWAVLRAGTGEAGRQMVERGHRLEIGGTSMIGWCVANRQARIALDVGEEAVRFDNPLLPETRSEMALPLVSRGQAIGALTIQSSHEAAFTEENITVLQTMASQVANAIENARLFERTQTALKEMEATHRRYLQQAWTEYLQTAKATGYEIGRPDAAPLGNAVLSEIQQAMERQSTPTAAVATVLTGGDGEGKDHSALVAPIALSGTVIGALSIHDDDGARQWTKDEIAFIEAIAERMALAAETLRLLEETQRRAARERLTREVTDKMRRAIDMDTLLQTVVRETATALDASGAFVQLSTPPEMADKLHPMGDGGENGIQPPTERE